MKIKQKLHGLFIVILLLQSLTVQTLLAEDSAIAPIQNSQQVFITPDYRGDFMDRSTLSGDWGGTRQEWANNGITLDGNLTQATSGVVSGGLETGWEYMGRGETTLNIDTSKAGLWPGGLFTIIGEGNFGNALTKNTGSIYGTNANDLFPQLANSVAIPNLTLTQFLSPKFGVAFGKFATITSTSGDMNEFAHGKGSENFLNPAFNFNPTMAVTVPYSTLGVSTLFIPSKDLIITAGVLDPHGVPDSSGLDTLFENGATLATEARYTTNFFSMTGHQLLGATYSSSSYTDLDQSALNLIFPGLPTKEADNSWAVYWNTDQFFYQPEPSVNKGLGLFARAGISDGRANPVHDFVSIGISGKGMIPCRENDNFGLGYFYTWIADTRITDRLGFSDAQGLEAYYAFAITPALRLTPDIQWIQPSQEHVDSSWVTGLRLFSVF